MQPWEQYQTAQTAQQPWETYGAPPQPQPEPSFMDRVRGDVLKRANEGADAIVAYKNNEQGLLQTGAQLVGKMGAGTTADILAEGVKGAYKSLPDPVQKYVGDKASQAGNYIASTDVGKAGIEGARQIGEKYQQFANANPNAARTLESVGDVANIAALRPGIEPAAGAVNNTVGKMGDLIADAPSAANKIPISADTVKTAARNAYDHVEKSGTGFQPSLADKAIDILDKAKQQPIAGKVLTSESADINKALGEYGDLKNTPLSITDFQALDSSLGDKAAQAYVSGNANKGRIISQAQDEIRSLVKPGNLQPQDLTGTREGIDALTQHAIPLWSTQAKMADIEKIVTRANMMDNPSTGIKTGFRNLALNKNRMASYPPDVQKLIVKAATTGRADDILGIIGSRLNGIIGGVVGGIPGSIVTNASSMAARGLRTAAKVNQAQKVSDALVENVRPSIEKYLKPVPALALPPPTIPVASAYPNLAAHPAYGPLLKQAMSMPPAQARALLTRTP